jgi:hypothetical protein
MTITILDPTHEEDSKFFQMASGIKILKGARIGFISNGKKGPTPFNIMESLLKNEYEVGEVVRAVKKNYSAPVATEIMNQVPKWDTVVTEVGD